MFGGNSKMLYGYGNEFGVPDKEKKLTLEEQEEKDIASLLGELEHAEKILTSFGCPEYRAINRQLSEMSDEKIREIIYTIPLRQAMKIWAQMNKSWLVGDVTRVKKFLDRRLASCQPIIFLKSIFVQKNRRE